MGFFSSIGSAFKDVGNAFKSGINFVGDKVLKPGINFIGNDVLKPTIGTGLNIINTGVGVIGKGAETIIDKGGQIIDRTLNVMEKGAGAGISTWEKMMGTLTSPFGMVSIGIVGVAVIMLLRR